MNTHKHTMKKLLTLITLFVGFGIAAQAITPVQEAKIEDYFHSQLPLVETALACKYEARFEIMQEVLDAGYYMAGITAESDKIIVDMIYTSAEMDFQFGGSKMADFLLLVTQDPTHEASIEFCDLMQSKFPARFF